MTTAGIAIDQGKPASRLDDKLTAGPGRMGAIVFLLLGFEFVNDFHDTANAVAPVIYTHTLTPHVAVAWWVLTLPVSILMSGSLFCLFTKLSS